MLHAIFRLKAGTRAVLLLLALVTLTGAALGPWAHQRAVAASPALQSEEGEPRAPLHDERQCWVCLAQHAEMLAPDADLLPVASDPRPAGYAVRPRARSLRRAPSLRARGPPRA